ncbi:hypothetical protein AURDEDRAFT_182121 [Auricularia subglabra TFB-10046 SS5]|nr:hypothetical protein AURDEDRAFT_182121 [Auricularia subglabra TFB-10046 SS5]
MLTYRGFEAWVECDGEPLRSYDAWCEGRVIGATVASEAGKAFGIHWRDLEGGVESFGIVTIDGTIVGGRGLNGTPGRVVAKTAWRPRDAAPDVPERQLVFAPLITTDDENVLMAPSAAHIDKVGTIELKVDLVRYGPRQRERHGQNPYGNGGGGGADNPFAVRVVHETSKKMGGHQVSLGEALPMRGGSKHALPPKRKRLPYDDRDQGPHVVFRFSYAPRDILMAQGVIPRPVPLKIEAAPSLPSSQSQQPPPQQPQPQANPLFTRSDTVDLTQDDASAPAPAVAKAERAASVIEQKELVGMLQEQLRHAREELARKQASFKVEQTPEPFSAYQYFTPGEVIDLTDL